eukprot:1156119-Pelagomonas_calceolata.AAC.14
MGTQRVKNRGWRCEGTHFTHQQPLPRPRVLALKHALQNSGESGDGASSMRVSCASHVFQAPSQGGCWQFYWTNIRNTVRSEGTVVLHPKADADDTCIISMRGPIHKAKEGAPQAKRPQKAPSSQQQGLQATLP